MGAGGIDYVYADNDGRRLYVPRGGQILAFDLDTFKSVGAITNTGGHGVAVDPRSHHGFSSSGPVSMFDAKTLELIKKIDVQGRPDGIFIEPMSERVYVFSHSQPNATVLDPKDGSIAGTIDLGGSPEQAVSDENGHLYVDLEDKDSLAVVDVKTLKVTGRYELNGKGVDPAASVWTRRTAFCSRCATNRRRASCLAPTTAKSSATLPIGNGTDSGGFNPKTMEAFSSQRDGTLTIIKETSPTSFEVEQTVQTKQGAKTCTLDTKNDRIILIATERAPTPTAGAGGEVTAPAGGNRPGGGRGGGPGFLDILAVGR